MAFSNVKAWLSGVLLVTRYPDDFLPGAPGGRALRLFFRVFLAKPGPDLGFAVT